MFIIWQQIQAQNDSISHKIWKINAASVRGEEGGVGIGRNYWWEQE